MILLDSLGLNICKLVLLSIYLFHSSINSFLFPIHFSRNETHFATNELNDGFALHTISFQWYPVIGAFMTWIPAIIASYLTGGQDMSKFNIQLLSPIVQRMLPKRYQHTELESASKMSCRKRAANECVEARELTELIQSNDEK